MKTARTGPDLAPASDDQERIPPLLLDLDLDATLPKAVSPERGIDDLDLEAQILIA